MLQHCPTILKKRLGVMWIANTLSLWTIGTFHLKGLLCAKMCLELRPEASIVDIISNAKWECWGLIHPPTLLVHLWQRGRRPLRAFELSMHVIYYNWQGLQVGNSAGDDLLQNCDILCLQEPFLTKQDLDKLNSFNDNFHRAGTSTAILTMVVVRGWIAGGVATLWHKRLDWSWILWSWLVFCCMDKM